MAGWLCFLLCLGLSPILLVSTKPEQRNYRIIVKKINVKPSATDLFQELNFKVTQFRFTSGYMILQRNVDQLEMQTILEIQKTNNQTRRLFDVRLDGCQFFSTIHKNRLLSLLAKSLKTAIHGNLKCPVIADFNYTLNNWHLEETDFPNYLPECNLKAVGKFYIHNSLALTMAMEGRIEHKN